MLEAVALVVGEVAHQFGCVYIGWELTGYFQSGERPHESGYPSLGCGSEMSWCWEEGRLSPLWWRNEDATLLPERRFLRCQHGQAATLMAFPQRLRRTLRHEAGEIWFSEAPSLRITSMSDFMV